MKRKFLISFFILLFSTISSANEYQGDIDPDKLHNWLLVRAFKTSDSDLFKAIVLNPDKNHEIKFATLLIYSFMDKGQERWYIAGYSYIKNGINFKFIRDPSTNKFRWMP